LDARSEAEVLHAVAMWSRHHHPALANEVLECIRMEYVPFQELCIAYRDTPAFQMSSFFRQKVIDAVTGAAPCAPRMSYTTQHPQLTIEAVIDWGLGWYDTVKCGQEDDHAVSHIWVSGACKCMFHEEKEEESENDVVAEEPKDKEEGNDALNDASSHAESEKQDDQGSETENDCGSVF